MTQIIDIIVSIKVLMDFTPQARKAQLDIIATCYTTSLVTLNAKIDLYIHSFT